MKRFILQITLRLALLAALATVFLVLLPKRWYLGHEYARWELLFEEMENGDGKRPANLILGDSRPEMGLSALRLNAKNFGLGGASPVEGYYFLRKMGNWVIDTLYLSYAPFHLQSMDCFYTRSDYYDFIDEGFVKEVKSLAESKRDTAFLRNNWPWLDVLERDFPWRPSRELVKYVPTLRNLKNWRWHFEEGEAYREQMKSDGLSFLLDSETCPRDSASPEVALEERQGGFQPSPVNDHYFQKLLALAAKRRIQVIWVNMPLSETTRQTSQQYFADFDSYLRSRLPKGSPIVPFTTYDHCQFRDFNHLDRQGAERFTRAMKSLLQHLSQ